MPRSIPAILVIAATPHPTLSLFHQPSKPTWKSMLRRLILFRTIRKQSNVSRLHRQRSRPRKYGSDTYDFLIWAEGNRYKIPQYIEEPVKHVIRRAIADREEEENQKYLFPTITREQFEMVQKEPVWTLQDGILFLLGRRQRNNNTNKHYQGQNGLERKIMAYASAAHRAGSLNLIEYIDGMFSQSRVVPSHFIEWAKTLPIQLPMLKTTPVAPRPIDLTHSTPEMELMFDAIVHFWSHYKADNSTASAPLKKLVTSWLHEEATKRGVTLSKNLAEAIDTIIRPPKERGGGYKSTMP